MERTDRLVRLTYIAFVPLAVLTAIFGPVLILFPESTRVYWAWEIRPAMSAVFVGAGYTFGAISIPTMLIIGRWRTALLPLIATWPFSIVVLAATLLHLDRFFLGNLSFYIWFVIYLALPFVLPVLWWLNRKRDSGPQPDDMLVPGLVSVPAEIVGVVLALLSLLMIFSPSTAATFWPWQLTPLMSRIIAAWLAFIATGLLCLLFERRYIAYRRYLLPAAAWFTLLFIVSVFHMDNFDFNRSLVWVWFVIVGGASLAVMVMYFYLERRYRTWQQRMQA